MIPYLDENTDPLTATNTRDIRQYIINDWTVGRRGIPYWDWGEHTGQDWIRDQFYAGPYSPKKRVYKRSEEGVYTEKCSWTNGFTANGYRMIRFSDILLMIAECQINTGDLIGARDQINRVRSRAANPNGFVMEYDGTGPSANYQISEYPTTGYPFDTPENALKALRIERKLELGMEGHRWFDLNRWGITEAELNRTLEYEKPCPGETFFTIIHLWAMRIAVIQSRNVKSSLVVAGLYRSPGIKRGNCTIPFLVLT